jgi:outer membrane lipase/esterase
MNIKKRILPAVLATLFAVGASVDAQAAPFSGVVVFGDSLSDAGYFRPFLASRGFPAAQMGRFSTNPDPVWTELISQFYGFSGTPSNAGGTNYAQGGARVTQVPGQSTPPGMAERPVSTQVSEYLTSRNNAADPNALYTMFAGANDFFVQFTALQAGQITSAQLQTNVLLAATQEVQQVGRLSAAGARYIMVVGGFDAAMTPSSLALDAATRAAVTQLTAGYNLTLWTSLLGAGIRVIPVDLFSLFNEIRANPSAYGFTNITGVACGQFPGAPNTSSLFCLQGVNTTATLANTYMFADATGHLTAASNRIIAQFAESLIEGPYNYSMLAEAPLRTRAIHVMGIADGLANGRNAALGKYTVFAGGGIGEYDVDQSIGNAGASNKSDGLTIGVTVRASESVTLGAAYGQTRNRGAFGVNGGDFKARDNNWSVFGSINAGRFYASAVGTIADIQYNDIHRNIQLGNVLRTATASTNGSNASVFLNAGYDFSLGRFLIGPVVSATWQDVEVAGFEEAGAGSANLRMSTQKRRSQVWSGGLRASCDFEGWTPWIRFTADKETEDDPRFVTASPMSIVTGNQYDVPAYVGDSSYTTFSAGIRGWLMPNVALGLSYYMVNGRSGTNEQGGSLVLSFKF